MSVREDFCRVAATTQDAEACVFWPFGKTAAGYGTFRYRGKDTYAHRFVCQLAHGDPMVPSLHTAHSCRTPSCVNPHHLRWATAAENIADKWRHGTMLKGEQIGGSKLTSAAVAEIRRRYATGFVSQRELADEYQVNQQQISKICRFERWCPASPHEPITRDYRHIGSKHPGAKLDETAVLEIRRVAGEGMAQSVLAKQYGVSTATIWAVVARKVWKHV